MRSLLVVPPFGSLDRPSLGIHTVQAFARRRGHTADIFYGNMAFAAQIGEVAYMLVATFGVLELLGERIMGLPLGATIPDWMLAELNRQIIRAAELRGLEPKTLDIALISEGIEKWCADVAAVVSKQHYDVIGFSTTFEQTNAVALLAKICRRTAPDAKLVVGGANCEGPMASAISRLIPELDMVFSGESEIAFARYLDDPANFAGQTIIYSPPNDDLNSTPALDYSGFFQELDRWLPESILRIAGDLRIPYESSRGCWWGQKHHCTFCGLNGGGIGYREKAPDKVIAELAEIAASTGVTKVEMTDNIMPYSFFDTLIPKLAEANLGLEIFYEQKANISLEKVLALKAAGVNAVQPGIESLNDSLLRLMRKGTSSRQNIALLRYGRSTGVDITWNILSGFPGEYEEWYQETVRLLPLISHLQPPTGFYKVNFDRFSPYYENARHYGIENLYPAPSYAEAFPGCDCLPDLAYHFHGESTGLTVEGCETLRTVKELVGSWQHLWTQEGGTTSPCLEIMRLDDETYMMVDTRSLQGTQRMQQISAEQASVALSFHTLESAATRWGEDNSVCIKIGDGYIPLACASPSVLQHFERIRRPDLADAPI